MDMVSSSSNAGHCNTMGTASSMNSVAEALGMSYQEVRLFPLLTEKESKFLTKQEKELLEWFMKI